MTSTNCLNCNTPLHDGQHFCPTCGQKAKLHRITLPHFFHEFFHAFTHADKGFFYLFKKLATQPGTTAREYIEGKRKKYFSPFTFFLIVMALFVFSNSVFKVSPPQQQPNPAILAQIPSEKARAKYITMIERVNVVAKASTKGNIIAMFAIPFISLFTWLFFYKRKYNYAEHLTANLLFVSFNNLIFTFTIFPLQAVLKGTPWYHILVYTGLGIQVLYMWWSLNGFLQLTDAPRRARSLLVSALAIIGWVMFALTVMAVYLYRSWDFYKFYSRIF